MEKSVFDKIWASFEVLEFNSVIVIEVKIAGEYTVILPVYIRGDNWVNEFN